MGDGRARAAELDLRSAGAVRSHDDLFLDWRKPELDFLRVEGRMQLSCLESRELNLNDAGSLAGSLKGKTSLLVSENAGDLRSVRCEQPDCGPRNCGAIGIDHLSRLAGDLRRKRRD